MGWHQYNFWNKRHMFHDGQVCNCKPMILDVRITVSVLDTVYKVDLIFLLVRLSRLQFQILFSNILDFSEFSGIFLNYFGKSPKSVSTDTDNRLYYLYVVAFITVYAKHSNMVILHTAHLHVHFYHVITIQRYVLYKTGYDCRRDPI